MPGLSTTLLQGLLPTLRDPGRTQRTPASRESSQTADGGFAVEMRRASGLNGENGLARLMRTLRGAAHVDENRRADAVDALTDLIAALRSLRDGGGAMEAALKGERGDTPQNAVDDLFAAGAIERLEALRDRFASDASAFDAADARFAFATGLRALSDALESAAAAGDSAWNAGSGWNAQLHRLEAVLRRLLPQDAGKPAAPPTDLAGSKDGVQRLPVENKTKIESSAAQFAVSGERAVDVLARLLGEASTSRTGGAEAGVIVASSGPRDLDAQAAERLEGLLERLRKEPAAEADAAKAGVERPTTAFAAGATSPETVRPTEGVPTARPDASAAVDVVRQTQELMAEMVERMQGAVGFDRENMRAVMHLDPPVLGRVHVQISVDANNRVSATVHAEDPGTQDFMQDNASDFRDGLARQGFAPEDIEIAFDEAEAETFAQTLNQTPAASRA